VRSDLELPYSRVAEIAEKPDVSDANNLLQTGWTLIKAVEKLGIDEQGHQITTLVYILGRLKDSQRRKNTQRQRQQSGQNDGTDSNAPLTKKDSEQKQSIPMPPEMAIRPQIPDILSLPIRWRQKNEQNKNFFYAFVNTLEGNPDPIISKIVKMISENNGALIQDTWRFSISKNGQFLQRSKAKIAGESPN
jgi:hypothetical protein